MRDFEEFRNIELLSEELEQLCYNTRVYAENVKNSKDKERLEIISNDLEELASRTYSHYEDLFEIGDKVLDNERLEQENKILKALLLNYISFNDTIQLRLKYGIEIQGE